MKWLLVLLFYNQPVVIPDYFATQDDCRYAGEAVRAQEKSIAKSIHFYCVPVNGM